MNNDAKRTTGFRTVLSRHFVRSFILPLSDITLPIDLNICKSIRVVYIDIDHSFRSVVCPIGCISCTTLNQESERKHSVMARDKHSTFSYSSFVARNDSLQSIDLDCNDSEARYHIQSETRPYPVFDRELLHDSSSSIPEVPHHPLGIEAHSIVQGLAASKPPPLISSSAPRPRNDPAIRHRRNQSSFAQLNRPPPLGLSTQPETRLNSTHGEFPERPDQISATRDDEAQSQGMTDIKEPAAGRLSSFYQNNKGLCYVLLAQVFGCLMNVTTRLLEVEGNNGAGMHPFQILFVRMTITTVLSTTYMWWTQIPHFPFGLREVRWLLAIRGIGGFFGVFGMYCK